MFQAKKELQLLFLSHKRSDLIIIIHKEKTQVPEPIDQEQKLRFPRPAHLMTEAS